MQRSNHNKKAAIFLMRTLITREIMRSSDVQCNTGEWPEMMMMSYT